MKTLKGKNILLRALEPTDLDFLYELENDTSIWEVSNTIAPYSRYILKKYLENSHKDIFEVKQLRLVICNSANEKAVGCIDFYDFDPKNKRVGIGVVIFSNKEKRKGHAFEAIKLLCEYAFEFLDVHQVYATISEGNVASIKLFEKVGFIQTGIKKDWFKTQREYKDELHYQLINNVH